MDGHPGHDSHDTTDPGVLPGLFAMLGPRVAAELQQHFGTDLRKVRDLRGAAIGPPCDRTAVARQAHVLVALAGTVGAGGLAALARRLLHAATQGDAGTCGRALRDILPRIDALLAFVAVCPLPADRSLP